MSTVGLGWTLTKSELQWCAPRCFAAVAGEQVALALPAVVDLAAETALAPAGVF